MTITMQEGPWRCDTCGKPIETVEDGWVEWLSVEDLKNNTYRQYGLRLVHHKPASPRNTEDGCQYNAQEQFQNNRATVQDTPLEELVGGFGLMNLLEYIDAKDLPNKDVVEMIKRLHVPLYEQARLYFDDAISEGIIQPNGRPGFYTQDQMENVVQWAEENKK